MCVIRERFEDGPPPKIVVGRFGWPGERILPDLIANPGRMIVKINLVDPVGAPSHLVELETDIASNVASGESAVVPIARGIRYGLNSS